MHWNEFNRLYFFSTQEIKRGSLDASRPGVIKWNITEALQNVKKKTLGVENLEKEMFSDLGRILAILKVNGDSNFHWFSTRLLLNFINHE